LFKSDEPEDIPKVLEALKQLMSELSERGRLLSAAGEPKLTRELAEADPRMRPRVVVIDECQELFVSECGEEAEELVSKIVAKARKYGVTLVFATPVPSADSLPRKVAKVLSNKACFAIGDHQGNDAILGTGKHKAGITATTLRPMTQDADGTVELGDLGTAMTVGFMPTDGLMRCYYVRRGSGVDEVTPVVQRALTQQDDHAITTTPPGPDTDLEQRDLLADVAEALAGCDRLKATDVTARLREIAPSHSEYQVMTGEDLAARLETEGVPVRRLKGVLTVRAENVHAALADRAEQDTDDTEDTGGKTG
jgi:DNA segregation ATPase FtsK/SpoIIIE, S-DNA-T family